MINISKFNSLTTTGTSGAATLTNGVLNVPNYDTGSAWIDYSATSTIVGWSSFTLKIIRYRVIGKQIFVNINLSGTSNSATTSFTLPFQNKNIESLNMAYAINNGTNAIGSFDMAVNSSTCACYQNYTPTWVASGTKLIYGQFFYEIA